MPATEDIVLRDGAVNIDATYLYADLAQSSLLGQKIKNEVAAKVIRSYLNAATRLLRNYGGEIRSFDGDRVLAIFIGKSKNTSAVRAAFALNWVVQKVLTPKLAAKWPDRQGPGRRPGPIGRAVPVRIMTLVCGRNARI